MLYNNVPSLLPNSQNYNPYKSLNKQNIRSSKLKSKLSSKLISTTYSKYKLIINCFAFCKHLLH